ncbi:MAG TPA: ATP-binding cassette domain-containing protein [Anaerolineaceae bacterium]|nr:ATP-binding cassette domain-containing protein [Anaerolineaceae bacterium]
MTATNAMFPPTRASRSAQPVIELVDVTLRFPTDACGDTLVLDRLNLSFFPGQRYAITGASGAGKTALLKLIAGKLVPTQGAILRQLPPNQIAQGGKAPTYLALPGEQLIDPVCSLVENLDRAPFIDRELASALLETLNLSSYAGKPFDTWPQTARYRADIVWAFSQTAPVLLIDELPGLDLDAVAAVAGMVQTHATQTGQCILLACRQPSLAMRFSQRVVFLDRGRGALDSSSAHREPTAHAAQYTIVIAGAVDSDRARWFGATHWQVVNNLTVMVIAPKDQAGLFGILTRIRDLGLEIDAIQRNLSA